MLDGEKKNGTLERMAIDYQALTLFCVDYRDILSNLWYAIRALNDFSNRPERKSCN